MKDMKGVWGVPARAFISFCCLAFALAILIYDIYYLTQINWFAHATRPDCNSTATGSPAECCCPDGAADDLPCNVPRNKIHSTLINFMRWPAMISTISQGVLFGVLVIIVVIYIRGAQAEMGDKPKKGVKIAIVFMTAVCVLMSGFGSQYSSAYANIQHGEWPVFWGVRVSASVEINSEANSGTADCYNQWHAANSTSAGKTGPENLYYDSMIIFIMWGVQALVVVLVLAYIQRYSNWTRPSERRDKGREEGTPLTSTSSHFHDVSLPGAHARARTVPDVDLDL